MQLTPQIMSYISTFGLPFMVIGFVKVMFILRDVMAMRMGKVNSFETTENGQLKEKWIKPNSGQVKSKDGTSRFNFNVGYIWRRGSFPSKPTTIVDGKNKMQINLLDERNEDVGAKDSSNLIIRSYNEGYLDGFKKNKLITNIIYIIALACIISAIAGILGYQQNTQIINMLGVK